MRLRFWGVRGSLPTPGPDTVRYGGNTTCIEIETDSGERIILDGGTGIRNLGLRLARSMPVECHVFISHTHWDHIHGLPFFVPLFAAGNRVTIYGPPDPVAMCGVESVLGIQMAYPHFPVRTAELKAAVEYMTLREGQTVAAGSAEVSTLLMNHPALCFGFKVRADGRTIFFTGDHEPFANIYDPGDPEFDDYQRLVDERRRGVAEFLRGVDLLVADAQYTDEEYAAHRGWGHSSYAQVMDLARRTGIPRVAFTHHETSRTDRDLDELLPRLAADNPDLRLWVAAEGLVLDPGD